MIYGCMRYVEANLRARKFPIRAFYDERFSREDFRTAVVFRRDRDGGDGSATGPLGVLVNPHKSLVRPLGVVATIYAASTKPGAQLHEHEHECDDYVDAVLVALEKWVRDAKAGTITYTSARMLAPESHPDLETWPGVVFELRFAILRGVHERTYAGEARPTGAPSTVRGRTEVRQVGASTEAPPDVGCDSVSEP